MDGSNQDFEMDRTVSPDQAGSAGDSTGALPHPLSNLFRGFLDEIGAELRMLKD